MKTYQEYLVQGSQAGSRYCLSIPGNVPRGLVGSKLGSRPGSSLEFMDHRQYLPGDDLRSIDWSAYARSDKLAIKLFREEVSPHVDIIIDGSASMALEHTAKLQGTISLAAVFAEAAANAGYTHRAWLAGENCREVENGRHHPTSWTGFDFEFSGNAAQSFQRKYKSWHHGGIRVFISDLLWMGDPQEVMTQLNNQAALVVVVQLLARVDSEPPQRGNIRLVDSESQEMMEIFIDAAAQQRYRNRLARHQQNWNTCCRQSGAIMTTMVAEDMVSKWSFDELVKREIFQIKR